MENQRINVKKYNNLLIKICKDLKINDYEKIVNCYINEKKLD